AGKCAGLLLRQAHCAGCTGTALTPVRGQDGGRRLSRRSHGPQRPRNGGPNVSRAGREDMARGGGAVVGLAFVAVGVLGALPAVAARTDSAVYAPPGRGRFAYNAFVPARTPGFSYVDPVFRETVRRLTTDHAHDDIYARNMW